jgi:Immunity protein 8
MMLRPHIQQIACLDVPDVQTWCPARPEDLFLGVDIKIGVEGEWGSDDFQLVVASSSAITKHQHQYATKHLDRALVLEEFAWDTVVEYIHQKTLSCTGANWEEIAAKLTEYFLWEYEDYQPDSEQEM